MSAIPRNGSICGHIWLFFFVDALGSELRSSHLLNPYIIISEGCSYTHDRVSTLMVVGLSRVLLNSYTASYHQLWNPSIWKSTTPSPKQRLRNHTGSPLTIPLLVSLQLNHITRSISPVVHSCPLSSSVTPKALPCWQQRPRKCSSYNSNYFSSFSVLLKCSFTFLPGGHTAALPWKARFSWWKGGDGSTRASLHWSTFLGLLAPILPHHPASFIFIYPRINLTNCTWLNFISRL